MIACWVIAVYLNYKEKQRIEENNRLFWIQERERHERLRQEEEKKKKEYGNRYYKYYNQK